MSVTETSKQSYKKLGELGPRQLSVYKAIKELVKASNRDIAKHMGISINEITPRVYELRKYGFVAEHGKKWDPETGRNVIAWCVIDPNDKKLIDLSHDEGRWAPAAVSWASDDE